MTLYSVFTTKTLPELTSYPTKTRFLCSLWTLSTLNTSALLTLSTCINTMVTLNTLMTQIRVSDDAHVKIMDRRTHVLINTVQVVDDIIAKVDGVKTAPVDVLSEPCKQCESYRKELEAIQINSVSLQCFENMKQECDDGIDRENKLQEKVEEFNEENENLMKSFNAANDEIERLGGKQVLLPDSEESKTPNVQVESTEPTTRRRGLSQKQIDEMNEEAESETHG